MIAIITLYMHVLKLLNNRYVKAQLNPPIIQSNLFQLHTTCLPSHSIYLQRYTRTQRVVSCWCETVFPRHLRVESCIMCAASFELLRRRTLVASSLLKSLWYLSGAPNLNCVLYGCVTRCACAHSRR